MSSHGIPTTALLLLAACSSTSNPPDGGVTGQTNAATSSTTGAATSGTVAGTTGHTAATSGATGGTNTGGTTGNAATSGSSTSGSGGAFGTNCSSAAPCAAGLICEQPEGLNQGFCTIACPQGVACPGSSSCVELNPGNAVCLLSCSASTACTLPFYGCDPNCQVCVPEFAEGVVSCSAFTAGGGGHASDGGACGPLPSAGALSWSASVEVSGSPLTYAEAEGVLSADDGGQLVLAFMTIPDAGGPPSASPFNWLGLATSANDGTSFAAQPPLISASDYQLYDPSFARDSAGNLYLAYAGIDQAQTAGELYVQTSANAGTSWSAATDALPTGFDLIDKPFLALNPLTELPAAVFADLQQGFGAPSRVAFVGATSATAFTAPVDLDTDGQAAFRDLASLAFDSTGLGYAVWVEVTNAGSDSAIYDQATGTQIVGSTANSVHFAGFLPASLATQAPTAAQVSGSGESVVVDCPRIAVTDDGAQAYVAYVVASATNATQIRVATSSDQGTSWGTPVTVNDDGDCATHFHPAVFLDPTGTLWVSWVDNRDGNGHVFYASSTNGQAFSPSALISDTPFVFTSLINSAQDAVPGWLGGYQFLGGAGTQLYSVWTADIGDLGAANPAHLYFSKAALP